jgi:hypothetical protein
MIHPTLSLLPCAPLRSLQVLLHAESLAQRGFAPALAAALPPNFPRVAVAVVRSLNAVARLDLPSWQDTLGAPLLRLETFHMVGWILGYCSDAWAAEKASVRPLLDESLLLTGLFALLHPANQDLLHWGTSPTILQRLANLPFGYFSDPKMARRRPSGGLCQGQGIWISV